jgi:hypothetical protein
VASFWPSKEAQFISISTVGVRGTISPEEEFQSAFASHKTRLGVGAELGACDTWKVVDENW